MTTPQQTVQLVGASPGEAKAQLDDALATHDLDRATLTELPFELDVESATDLSGLLMDCIELTSVHDLVTDHVTNVAGMFANTPKLMDGHARLIGKHDDVDTTSMIDGSGLTREPFFHAQGHPWGTVNPQNSLTRRDTGGVRPDLFQSLQETMISRQQVNKRVDTVKKDLAEDIQEAYEEGEAGLKEAQRINDILAEDFDGDLQVAWNTTTTKVNNAQQAAIAGLSQGQLLHDNQLRWNKWTKHFFDFRFTTQSGENVRVGNRLNTGLVDLDINGDDGSGIIVTERPGWSGAWKMIGTPMSGAQKAWTGFFDEPRTDAIAYNRDIGVQYRYVELHIWPEWSTEPREYTIRTNGNQGFQYTDGYENTIEGNPISFYTDGTIAFPNIRVISSEDVQADIAGEWREFTSGTVVGKNVRIRPIPQEVVEGEETEGRLYIFTENQPAMQWEAGAPLNGHQSLNVAPQTLPHNLWTTVATWRGLEWDSPRAVDVDYTVRWDKFNSFALANYYIRIKLNGQQVGYYSDTTTLGMSLIFNLTNTYQMAAGDTLEFQAAADPGFSSERRINGGGVEINWT